MKNGNTMFDKMNNWIKNSVTLKLIAITILMLLLLIPASMIKSIIVEREALGNQAINEVSSKWAEDQVINGPILSVPLIYEYENEDEKIRVTRYLHVLPENLEIIGELHPKKLKRGIYEIVVYNSDLAVSGNFNFEPEIDRTDLKEIQYERSFLTIGISDLRGIKDNISFKWDDRHFNVRPGSNIPEIIHSGITVNLPDIQNTINEPVNFGFSLNLNGSKNISFIPLGGSTKVNLSSEWSSPSFNGNFLPDFRNVTDEGFTAEWKILQLNRNFPQSWTGSDQVENVNNSVFGVDMILPLDDYQKSTRSAKYAVMTIALTFLVFFLVEIINGRKIHPFQYILIGLALCLFYILLVSISEHSNFIFAYIISATGIITMISLYSISVFNFKKLSFLLGIILSGIYGFIFVTLQLVDYALLMGSIGLVLILGATMYFTRNINWYKLNIESN